MTYKFNAKHIMVMFLFMGIFFGSLRNMGDMDIWFQLLAGKYVIDHGAVPHNDFFIYAGVQNAQIFGGWGFGLIYEFFIERFGLESSTYINSTIWTASFVFAIKAAQLRSRILFKELTVNQFLGLSIVIAMVFIGLSMRMAMRAESTLVLSWTLSMWLFELSKSRNSVWRYWIALPLLGWAEALLHTGGFVLLLAVPINAAYSFKEMGSKKIFWTGWAACLLALLLLPVINPNGFSQVYIQFSGILNSLTVDLLKSAATLNLEYLPMWDSRSAGSLISFSSVVIIGGLIWIRRRGPGYYVENVLCLVFLAMAALHNRGISLAAMLLMVPAFEVAMTHKFLKFRAHGSVSCMLFVFLCGVPTAVSYSRNNFGFQGPSTGLESEAAIIKKGRPNGAHILTTENGPALAYTLRDERFLVSKGGHALVVNKEAENHQSLAIFGGEGWEADFEANKVDFVCVPFYLPMPGQGVFYWIPSVLVARNDWKLHIGGACNLLEHLPPNKTLTKKEVQKQTIIYLQNLAIFSEAEYYGQPDKLGQAIGRKATIKLKKAIEDYTSEEEDQSAQNNQ